MHKSIGIAMLMVLIFGVTQVQAQTRAKSNTRSEQEHNADFYIVAGLGHVTNGSNRFQVGGGIDAYLYKGFAIGGELAQTTGSVERISATILSANASFHFLKGYKASKFDPFVTGGYSRFMNPGQDTNTANFGGGLNYWLSKKFGLRFDLRDHVSGNGSFIGLRGGVAFAF